MSYKSVQHVLEERKLVEKSDNELTESLFSDTSLRKQESDFKQAVIKNIPKKSPTLKKEKIIESKKRVIALNDFLFLKSIKIPIITATRNVGI